MNPTIVPVHFTAKDKMSAAIAKMSAGVSSFSEKFNAAGKKAFSFGRKAFVTGAVIAAPLVLAAKQAVNFEDKMSDIGKTTGLQGKELRNFGESILQMSSKTRSSIDDLSTIAEIGGRLGITGSKNLQAFTASANEFAVALGGDFSGGVEDAITQFGKVGSLFADIKNFDAATQLKKAGSAFNSLSAKGVNVEGITDFSLRVGALPEVMRPSLASTSALGATLQKAGVDSQIASSGFSNFISKAASNLPAFAKEMGISTKQAQQLINTDTASFFAQFAAKMKGVPADKLAQKLKGLQLNSLEVQKAIGAMSGSLDVYNEMQKIASDQVDKGTSITDEYNTKNNNTAGQLAKLQNNLKALAITAGNALIPVINSLVESVSPMLQSFGKWMQQNKGLVTIIAKVALGVAAFSIALSGISFVVGGVQKALVIGSTAMKAFGLASNAALGPIGLIIGAVALVAGGIYSVAKANAEYKSSVELAMDVNMEATRKSRDQRVELKLHFDTLRRSKEGSEAYKNALASIENIMPGITDKYNLQTKAIDALNAAERESVQVLMERFRAESALNKAKNEVSEATRKREGDASTSEVANIAFRNLGTFLFGSAQDQMKVVRDDLDRQALVHDANAGRLIGMSQMHESNAQKIQSANPEQAKQESTLNQVLNITFSGLPSGADAQVAGNSSMGSSKIKLPDTH